MLAVQNTHDLVLVRGQGMEKLGLSCGEGELSLTECLIAVFLGATQEDQYAVCHLRQSDGTLGVHTACQGRGVVALNLTDHRNVHAGAECVG